MILAFSLIALGFVFHNSHSTDIADCDVNCYFTNAENEFVKCSKYLSNSSFQSVEVSCDKDNEITIGKLESIRSLTNRFLEELQDIQYLTINLHLMTLNSEILSSNKLSELNLIYAEKISHKSFINLPGLERINFGRITSKQLPEYFILRHFQKKRVTTINIEADCYKCSEDSVDLLVFPLLTKKTDEDSYTLQSIDSESCSVKSDLKYCKDSNPVIRKFNGTISYRSLRLDQKDVLKFQATKSSISIPLALFYIGLIICLTMTVLILCLLLLQLWTICQLKKANKILKGFQMYPIMNESEISDNNETNSCFSNNRILYQHNFIRSKT